MARRNTSPKKPDSRVGTSSTTTRKVRPQQTASPALAGAINRLKDLVERRKQDLITASWDLGKLAAEVLDQAEQRGDSHLTTQKLAEDIGVIRKPDAAQTKTGDSTLRQMIKFANRVTKAKAVELQKAGVGWRAVICWLGVKDKRNSLQLYQRMLSGFRNSTEIRRYIADNFDKQAHPRFSESLTEACEKVQTRAEHLITALKGFEQAYEKRWTSLAPAERKQGRSSLRELDKALKNTDMLISRVRAKTKAAREA